MKRVLGLDLGTVTLGVAISRTGIISQGYEEFRFENERYDIALKEVKRIVELEKIEYIALGYPLNMDGSIGERAQCSIDFNHIHNHNAFHYNFEGLCSLPPYHNMRIAGLLPV